MLVRLAQGALFYLLGVALLPDREHHRRAVVGLGAQFFPVFGAARDIVKAEQVIDYTRSENMAERFAKRFGAAVGGGAVEALHGRLPAIR